MAYRHTVASITQLRMIIAALGERAVPPWWRTTLLTDIGLRVTARVFPRTALQSALTSVFHAAQIDHDQRVGLDRYHLFRLPPDLERDVSAAIKFAGNRDSTETLLRNDRGALLAVLEALSGGKVGGRDEGPVRLGNLNQLRDGSRLPICAAEYLSAITSGVRRFPYFESSEIRR